MEEQDKHVDLAHITAGLKAFEINDDPGEVIRCLSSLPATVFFRSRSLYRSSILYAAEVSDFKFMRWLVFSGLYSGELSQNLIIAELSEAIKENDFEKVKLLVADDVAGCEQLFENRIHCYNLISLLLIHGCPPDCLEFVIEHLSVLKSGSLNKCDGYDHHGFTPLVCAVLANNFNCVQSLLEKGAKVNLTYDKFLGVDSYVAGVELSAGKTSYRDDIYFGESKTALMYAVCTGNSKCIEILLRFGADITRMCQRVMNVISYAASTCRFNCLELLLKTVMDHNVKFEKIEKPTSNNENAYDISDKQSNLMSPAFSFDFNASNNDQPKLFQAEFKLQSASVLKSKSNLTRNQTKLSKASGKRIKPSDGKHFAETESYLFGDHKQQKKEAVKNNDKKTIRELRNAIECALPCAVMGGDVQCLELLLKYCVNLNLTDKLGKTALMLAAEEGKIECVKLLLKNWAAPDRLSSKDSKVDTPLMLASKNGNLDCMELLLRHNAVVDAVNESNKTALMFACEYGKTECIKLLIEHKAKTCAQNERGQTPLIISILNRQTDCVTVLLQSHVDIAQKDGDGKNAIMHAAYLGELDCLEQLFSSIKTATLLNSGNDLKGKKCDNENSDGNNCNQSTGDARKIKVNEIEHNDDMEQIIPEQDNIEKASEVNDENLSHTELMSKLAEESLPYAMEAGNAKCIKMILPLCVNLNRTDNNGKTPLMLAAKKSQIELVELLLRLNADVNFKNSKGDSAFIIAARARKIECLKFLLMHGADPLQQNNKGETAAVVAATQGDSECLELLGKFGAVPRQMGPKVFCAAMCHKDQRCLKILTDSGGSISVAKLSQSRHFERILDRPDNLKYLLERGSLYMTDRDKTDDDDDIKGDHFPVNSDEQRASLELLLKYKVFHWDKFVNRSNVHWVLKCAIRIGVCPGKLSEYGKPHLYSLILYALTFDLSNMARFLLSNLYYTIDDYRAVISDKELRSRLKSHGVKKNPLLAQVCRKTWSLQTLSLLIVSTALFNNGSNKGRHEQVNTLPIPEKFKTILKFEGSHSRLCDKNWHNIGLPPREERCDMLWPTKQIYPPSGALEPCDRDCCDCKGSGFTIMNNSSPHHSVSELDGSDDSPSSPNYSSSDSDSSSSP